METRAPYIMLEPILSRAELDARAGRPASLVALESLRLFSAALHIPFDPGTGSQLDVELGLVNCSTLLRLRSERAEHGAAGE